MGMYEYLMRKSCVFSIEQLEKRSAGEDDEEEHKTDIRS
jgi:hypothetical protein